MCLISIAVTVLTAMTSLQQGPPDQKTGPFTPGEILMTFAPKSDAAAKVADAGVRGDQPGSDVAAYVSSMSKQLGVPMEAKQLGSGGTVLLVIRSADLPETIASRLRAQSFVKSVERAGDATKAASALRVELVPGSAEATRLGKAKGTPADHAGVAELAKKLTGVSGLALEVHVDPSGHVLVSPDLRQLTLDTIDRLKKRADVGSAQPNKRYGLRTGISG